MSHSLICRPVASITTDFPITDFPEGQDVQKPCTKCNEPAYIEKGMEGCKDPVVCLMCADDNAIVFVELPPDEFGRRSISVTAKQVREQDDGRWHKKGFWHSAQWAFANQES